MRTVEDRISRKFWQFHAENPHVYDELRELAFRLLDRGRTHYGIKALFEVARFHRALVTTDATYKLNNNYTALYARLLMEKEPRLEGFFDIRDRPSA